MLIRVYQGKTFDSFSFPSMGPDGSTTFVAYLPGDDGSGLFSTGSSKGLTAVATTRSNVPANSPGATYTGFRAGSGGSAFSYFVASQSVNPSGALYTGNKESVTFVAGLSTPLPSPFQRANFTGFVCRTPRT